MTDVPVYVRCDQKLSIRSTLPTQMTIVNHQLLKKMYIYTNCETLQLLNLSIFEEGKECGDIAAKMLVHPKNY